MFDQHMILLDDRNSNAVSEVNGVSDFLANYFLLDKHEEDSLKHNLATSMKSFCFIIKYQVIHEEDDDGDI